MTKQEIRVYLKKVYKKYPTFKQFIVNDPFGQRIAGAVYGKKFPKKEIYQLWEKRKGYTIKECIDIANRCSSRSEMRKKYPGYYWKICQKKWQKYVFKNLPVSSAFRGYTFEECKAVAKKCKNIYDMNKRFKGYHYKAYKKGWLKYFFKKNYQKIGYTYRQCQVKARKCKTKQEFQNRYNGYYQKALKKNWIHKICKHMVCGTNLRSITFKECQNNALECKSRNEFGQRFKSHYNRALKQKWLNKICKHMIFLQRNQEQKDEKKLKRILQNHSEIIHHQKLFKKYRSKPDFIIKSNNKIFIIELKSDVSDWSKNDLTKQKSKYNKLGKALFKPFEKTIIVSPKGVYGISFQELIELLE